MNKAAHYPYPLLSIMFTWPRSPLGASCPGHRGWGRHHAPRRCPAPPGNPAGRPLPGVRAGCLLPAAYSGGRPQRARSARGQLMFSSRGTFPTRRMFRLSNPLSYIRRGPSMRRGPSSPANSGASNRPMLRSSFNLDLAQRPGTCRPPMRSPQNQLRKDRLEQSNTIGRSRRLATAA
jgi:hypothetical protein